MHKLSMLLLAGWIFFADTIFDYLRKSLVSTLIENDWIQIGITNDTREENMHTQAFHSNTLTQSFWIDPSK